MQTFCLSMAGIVVVFDFDDTIIACDSDKWVVDEMGATEIFNDLLPTLPWNSAMGLIIEKIRASISSEATLRFIYVGDGKGDFCPSTKLKAGDHVMPRKNFPLWAIISSNPTTVKTEVHGWDSAGELERILIHLVTKICPEESGCTQPASAPDCKPRSLPISSQEAH
ncbi:hypothetical protein ACLOJK_040054 [Asimina triloba]